MEPSFLLKVLDQARAHPSFTVTLRGGQPAVFAQLWGALSQSERIVSGFVESAVNQVVSKEMVKHQPMLWTLRGAHLLLQIRTGVPNEKWEDTFRRWYSGSRPQTEEQPIQKAA